MENIPNCVFRRERLVEQFLYGFFRHPVIIVKANTAHAAGTRRETPQAEIVTPLVVFLLDEIRLAAIGKLRKPS